MLILSRGEAGVFGEKSHPPHPRQVLILWTASKIYRGRGRGGWTRSCDIRAYAILYGDFCIKSAKKFSR